MSLSNNYIALIIISVVIVVAIVGYVVDSKKENIDANLKEAPIDKTKEDKK